ncbi:M16 family metallopeptidase [Dolosicoccus paucivorans]|uniref:M16 family metallopeptidase n=1 Tax=Dolosicoccus paucivorans TaxID=84521 RepID=UPI00088EC43D|nr:insulinase family protein [Dolosicoccus paucivorans]SDI86341.1 Predicted Zn-dependent peptidase [Dolosicoccus paucivorans]
MKILENGVRLDVIQSNKYKTNRCIVKFITPYHPFEASALHLMSRMMEDGSNSIPSKGAIESILADLYGAELAISVHRRGHFHELTLSTAIVRQDLIAEGTSLTTEWFNLIKELLFNQAFDETNEGFMQRFNREKKLLQQAIERQKDNKARLARRRLYEELYQYEEAAYSAMANLDDLEKMTLVDLKTIYEQWLQTAEVVVLCHGEFNNDWVDKELSTWPLTVATNSYSYQNNELVLSKAKSATYLEEETSGKQGNLAMAFKVPYAETFKERMKLQLANTLFGQSPTSQLFTQIREKQSLAYSVSSAIDVARGLVVVTAGVDSTLGKKVSNQVVEELDNLIDTLQDDDHFNKIKLMLISNMVQSIDSQINELNYRFIEYKNPSFKYDVEVYTKMMNQLTAQEIKHVLKEFQLVQTFFLKGVESIDE